MKFEGSFSSHLLGGGGRGGGSDKKWNIPRKCEITC